MKWSRLALAALGAALVVTSCSDGEDRSEGQYCTLVGDNLTVLNAPPLATVDDVAAVVETWKLVAAAAPLAIEPEWDALIATLETAATIDPADTAAVQALADRARANEQSANRIIDYTFKVCGATIGPVTPVSTTG